MLKKDWLIAGVLSLLMVVMFGIVGSMEQLPPDAAYRLEVYRQNGVIMAGGY